MSAKPATMIVLRALAERCAQTLEVSENAARDWIVRMEQWLTDNEGVTPAELRDIWKDK